ncbi:MAG: hypothetical protein RL768_2793, partial [Nitrospirota bacterium]
MGTDGIGVEPWQPQCGPVIP